MKYQDKLFGRYYSTHYNKFLPRSRRQWDWVIDRFELNFGGLLNGLPRESLVLDLACGAGYLEYYLTKKGFTRIHAVDISGEQIGVAKTVLGKWGGDIEGKVEFHSSDAIEHLKGHREYDVIAMIDILEHFDRKRVLEALELAYGSLKKGGMILIRTSNADNPMWGGLFYKDFTHVTPFTPESIRQCLGLAGFEPVKIDYEAIPVFRRGRLDVMADCRRFLKTIGLAIAGKCLGISPKAFSEVLVAAAKKR